MNILLTGITGNLGYELAQDLSSRGINIIPLVRNNTNLGIPINQVIYNDLLDKESIKFDGPLDCILHSAGNVNFLSSTESNQKMLLKLIPFAKKLKIPLYLISTAYVYRPENNSNGFNNNYEVDKFKAERILTNSKIDYGIFRPSVLVGNTKTGKIQNFSGYYTVTQAFYKYLSLSKQKQKKLRFPKIEGKSNLVPVDQAAHLISDKVQNLALGTWYITNPNPPIASWVLQETLEFFNLQNSITYINETFNNYKNLDLTPEEKDLYHLIKYYYPYWSIDYDFPNSLCDQNLITQEYLNKTLTFLKSSDYLKNG